MATASALLKSRKKILAPAAELTLDYETFKARIKESEKGDLIEGVMKLKTPPSSEHEDLFGLLHFLLRGFTSVKDSGKIYGSRSLVKINERNGFEPDILFVAKEKLDIIKIHEILGAPDIVVEIISKSSRIDDRVRKFMGYEQRGVREYWLIDPAYKIVEFYELIDGHYHEMEVENDVFRSQALPGFWLKPEWLFASPMPNDYQLLQEILKENV